MNISIVEFPNSYTIGNLVQAYSTFPDVTVKKIWHQEETIGVTDLLVIPGGASFADYLRPGGLTKATSVSAGIRKFAQEGGKVLGIGNGFQILCELGLLPGALLENLCGHFVNSTVNLRVEESKISFGESFLVGESIELPLACRYGRYVADTRTLKDLEEQQQVVFRYVDQFGEVDEISGNGSLNAIAGVCNMEGNVLGLMAHPERVEDIGNVSKVLSFGFFN